MKLKPLSIFLLGSLIAGLPQHPAESEDRIASPTKTEMILAQTENLRIIFPTRGIADLITPSGDTTQSAYGGRLCGVS